MFGFLVLSVFMVALFTYCYFNMELITGFEIGIFELDFFIGIGMCN